MTAKAKKNPAEPEIYKAPDYKSIYVNFAQTAASPADISIGVGEASPSDSGGVSVEMRARLVMSPIQAKVMLGMLHHVIKQYEDQFGPVTIPPAVLSQLNFPTEDRESTEGV